MKKTWKGHRKYGGFMVKAVNRHRKYVGATKHVCEVSIFTVKALSLTVKALSIHHKYGEAHSKYDGGVSSYHLVLNFTARAVKAQILFYKLELM